LYFYLAKHGVCQLTNENGKAKKIPSPTIFHNSFAKNRIMDPLVLHVFFPRAPALVHAVFIFLRQFV
jgi:hypothetical protein